MQAEEIAQRIRQGLPGARVQVIDEVGDGNHFRAEVVAPQFEGKTLVQRHQLVYQSLEGAMRDQIHALSLRTLTPVEAGQPSDEAKTES